MLKTIATNRERPGGGKITRFALTLPWFCVWVDLCEAELVMYRQDMHGLATMLRYELERSMYEVCQKLAIHSFTAGQFETWDA